MRRPKLLPQVIALGLGMLAAARERPASSADSQADASAVIANVGAQGIRAAELTRRMAAVPPFQLRSFGATPDEMRRAFLERVLIREALFSQGAAARHLADHEEVLGRIRAVKSRAMLAKLQADVAREDEIKDEDVRRYYVKNAAKFHTPAKVDLWQIVVEKRDEAAAILDEMRKDPTPRRWSDLARERSLDKATNMRGGRLGFVSSDGETAEPGLKVAPEVLTAAAGVADGALVSDPVKDGNRWVLVWRRGTMTAVDRPLDVEAPSIRQILVRERAEGRVQKVLMALRAARVTAPAPDIVEQLEVSGTGEVAPLRRPGTSRHGHPASATPTPLPVPGGGLR